MNRRTSATWNWVYFWSALRLAQASLCVRSVDLYGFAGKTAAVLQTIARPKKVKLGLLVKLDQPDRLDHVVKKGLKAWKESLVQLSKMKHLNKKCAIYSMVSCLLFIIFQNRLVVFEPMWLQVLAKSDKKKKLQPAGDQNNCFPSAQYHFT